MNSVTTVAAIELLFTFLSKTVELSELIKKARNENRDITQEEWNMLDLAQAEAHSKLKDSIEQRKNNPL